MKKIALFFGSVLLIIGILQGGRYLSNYGDLTQYGKGYVWGSVILVVTGLLLIYYALRRQKA